VVPVADAERLTAMVALTREVPVPSHLVRHAVDLVVATHPGNVTAPAPVDRYVRFGASPRGAQSLILAAKAMALLDGRPSVAAEDIRGVARGALRHRLVLGYEAVADGVTADDLVVAVLDAVPTPTAGLRGAP
jgi:MoxR-like ATPase